MRARLPSLVKLRSGGTRTYTECVCVNGPPKLPSHACTNAASFGAFVLLKKISSYFWLPSFLKHTELFGAWSITESG